MSQANPKRGRLGREPACLPACPSVRPSVYACTCIFIRTEAPFGGFGQSGFGKEYGAMGFDEYLKTKVITGCKPGFSWEWYVPAAKN